jgi:molybdate transport system substrate-binding protein
MPRGSHLFRTLLALIIALTLGAVAGIGNGAVAAGVAIDCTSATPAAAAPAGATPLAAPAADATFPDGGGNLTVFAAASLTESFGQMKTDHEVAHPGLTITFNFAGSQALVTQLTQGAPADVFASASKAQMDKAVAAGVIDGAPRLFTQNRLALIVPNDNPAGVHHTADLAKSGLKLVLAQADVPVGMYARQALCTAGANAATYGDGFVTRVAANVVSEEDNVKAVVTKVQLGEADAGIVYTTDVTPDVAGDVTVIPLEPAINVVAKYPIAPVRGGKVDLAAAFIAYVLGPDGQATLAKFGFEPKP